MTVLVNHDAISLVIGHNLHDVTSERLEREILPLKVEPQALVLHTAAVLELIGEYGQDEQRRGVVHCLYVRHCAAVTHAQLHSGMSCR